MNIAIDYNNVLMKNESEWKIMARKFVKAGNEVYCVVSDENMSFRDKLEAIKKINYFLGEGHAIVVSQKDSVSKVYGVDIDYWID